MRVTTKEASRVTTTAIGVTIMASRTRMLIREPQRTTTHGSATAACTSDTFVRRTRTGTAMESTATSFTFLCQVLPREDLNHGYAQRLWVLLPPTRRQDRDTGVLEKPH